MSAYAFDIDPEDSHRTRFIGVQSAHRSD